MLFEELYEENYKIVYGYLLSLSKNESISEDKETAKYPHGYVRLPKMNTCNIFANIKKQTR